MKAEGSTRLEDVLLEKLLASGWLRRAATFSGLLVSAGGMAVLIGWSLRAEFLKRIVPNMVPTNPVTGVGFVLAGVSLFCFRDEAWKGTARQNLGRVLAAGIFLLGALKLGEYALGWNLNFDQLLFRGEMPGGDPSNRIQIAPSTALEFLLGGMALWFMHSGEAASYRRVQTLGLAVTFISLVPLVGYLYHNSDLYSIRAHAMALPTALLFCLMGSGVFLSKPEFGMAALLTRTTPGGASARRLLPACLIAPIALGALWHWGVDRSIFDEQLGVALLVVIIVAIFTLLVWSNAVLLDQTDQRRSEAEQNLRKAHDELEHRVQERTAQLSVANQELTAQVVERKTAEEHVRSQLGRLELLNRITRVVGERLDLASIFQFVVRTLEDQMPLDFCCVCRSDDALGGLTVATSGLRGAELAAVMNLNRDDHLDIAEDGLSQCMLGRLVYEPDTARSGAAFSQRLARAGLRALVIAPLAVESKIFGVIVSCRRQPESFSSAECEFLRQLSEHVALASHQAQLHAALQQAYDDLQQTQQTVLQQERLHALGQMASGIAHDINNTISPVTLYTESLLEQEPNLSPRARQYLETIQRSIEDVAQTVSRMREFYRRREPELTVVPVALNTLVKQVVELSRARWSDQPQSQGLFIQMAIELAADLPSICGVESEIREALLNLVFNAVDAMPEGGKLTVRTRLAKMMDGSRPRAVVEVVDTGMGMDEVTRRRCLEPFFTTKGERGTGLGLAMVYGIAERHAAKIEIDSVPKSGTTIRLIFPGSTQVSVAQEPSQAPSAPLGRLRILTVDDDTMLLKSLRHILETDGHVVVTAHGGQEGIDAFHLALADHKEFSVVITDLGMPQVDGRKVAEAIKEASPSTPVILLTGWGQRLLAEGTVPPNVDQVLSKPPKLRDLRQALAKCLAQPAKECAYA